MQKICTISGKAFEVTDDDLKFYEKISPVFHGKKYLIPAPSLCPEERQRRRLSFRNERNLFTRPSSLSKENIISMYPANAPFPVYGSEEWWSDAWDAREYGREFDFSRSFFEQFEEMYLTVPRIGLMNREHENSEYCNFALRNKNCYLVFTTGFSEDSFHCNRSFRSRNICDCSNITDSELCYEVIDSDNCYHCKWLQSCRHCANCTFGHDLKNCSDCFACWGLNQAKFCIFNKQYSPEEYPEKVREFEEDIINTKERFFAEFQKSIHKYADVLNIENCTGGSLSQSKNAFFCFEAKEIEDSKFLYDTTRMKNCYDTNNNDFSELDYEVIGGDKDYHQMFSEISWFNHEIFYCSLCFSSQNLFGCIGMKSAAYCILNKQYSKEQYEILVPKIIEHMMKTGEWGEFFPTKISPYGYNESMAQEYFPLTKKEVLERGWKWGEEEPPNYSGVTKKIPGEKLPKKIDEIPDDILNWTIECTESQKPFQIQKAELEFYRKMNIPIPKLHPNIRQKKRMKLRNPRMLWKRSCMKCNKLVQSTYAPDRPEIVYCEECYLQTVY